MQSRRKASRRLEAGQARRLGLFAASSHRRLGFEDLEERRMMAAITQREDDGSIPLANVTGLVGGQSVTASATIGDGPFGSTSGDLDFYSVFLHPDQTLTIDISAQQQGSLLDSVVAVYNSSGVRLAENDDRPGSLDSFLQFQAPRTGTYYVMVGQWSGISGFPTNPFDSGSGPGFDPNRAGFYDLTLSLTPHVNVAPVAVSDTFSFNEDTPTVLPILANDTDDSALNLASVTIVTPPAHGTIGFNRTTGAITFTPTRLFFGTDTFSYTVRDDEGAVSNVATVDLTINFVNHPPVAAADLATITKNTPAIIPILANDTDVDGSIQPGTVVIVQSPTHGTITGVNPSTGEVSYTPTANYVGPDAFSYTVKDNLGAVSNLGIVSIRVNSPPPVATDDSAVTAEETPLAINILANDTAPESTLAPGSVIATQPAHGTVALNAATGFITYTPALNYFGPDSFAYSVQNVDGATSNVATVSINVTFVNDPPVAVNDSAFVNRKSSTTINVLANDSDEDGPLVPGSVHIVSSPAHGVSSVDATTGLVTYTPDPAFAGSDSFTYTITDGLGAVSNTATVSILVNDLPVATTDNVSAFEEVPITINVLANDFDPDGTVVPSSLTLVGQPLHGTAVVNATTHRILYTPAPDFFGTDTFHYSIQDNQGATSNPVGTVNLTVARVNDPPVAVDDFAQTPIGAPITVNVIANDTDRDGAIVPSSLTIVTQPTSGQAVANPNGSITYTPNPGFAGADLVEYTVIDNDGGALSNRGRMLITVGASVTISGFAYVDNLHPNGVKDPGELGIPGVTITATKTDGPVTFSIPLITASDGSYHFVQIAGSNFILSAGTYTITETQPTIFANGGTNVYSNIVLGPGSSADNLNFSEQGLTSAFLALNVNRSFLFGASSLAATNLAQQNAWFSFPANSHGVLAASAIHPASAQGSVVMTLFDGNLQQVASASSTGAQAALLQYAGNSTMPYYLRVSGTNTAVTVNGAVLSSSAVSWHNTANPFDVNGDGRVSTIDAVLITSQLHQGAGALPLVAAQSGVPDRFMDVNGDGSVTTIDAIMVINWLKSHATSASGGVLAASASSASGAATPTAAGGSQTAIAVATDQAISRMTCGGASTSTASVGASAPVGSPVPSKAAASTAPPASSQASSAPAGAVAKSPAASSAWSDYGSEDDESAQPLTGKVQ